MWYKFSDVYTQPHNSGGVSWFHVGLPCVCPSIWHPSILLSIHISFLDDNVSIHQWIFHQTWCVHLILWRSGLGLLIGKFYQILTELSAWGMPIFLLSKYQEIITKFGTCIDIKEIWFGIANGQISSIFDRVTCPWKDNGGIFSFNIFISIFAHVHDLVANWSKALAFGSLVSHHYVLYRHAG